MTNDESGIRSTFVAAYPRYVSQLLIDRGIEINTTIADAVVEGTGVLNALLLGLSREASLDQRSSPLELFREALRPIDRALALLGVPVPTTGTGARSLAPWDRYALAPGSSKVLGEAAHDAHFRWGLAKAAEVAAFVDSTAGPSLGIFSSLSDRALIVSQAESVSYRTVVLPSDSAVSVAVVSADERGADEIVRSVSGRSRVIVYGDSIDDIDQIRFMSLGASSTVRRDSVLVHLTALLPPLV
ncbi:MAG: hypothetical protein BMS9Abin17_1045 [Acidimicrobiia bacterium]|nr:MAG: hypothetical protein BMS9Abin17_1045 [Acidimicrobiia bacterium]